MSDSYFKDCIGSDSYKPTFYGKHEGTHPKTVREVLAEFKGTTAADVICAFVFEKDLSNQRQQRMLEKITAQAEALKKAEEALERLSREIHSFREDVVRPDEWTLEDWARKADEGIKALKDLGKE